MWNPECAITEADAVLAAKNSTIKTLRIIKEGPEFYVLLQLNWRKEELFLATTRTTREPRRFKHLGRLVEYIENHYPGVNSLVLVLRH